MDVTDAGQRGRGVRRHASGSARSILVNNAGQAASSPFLQNRASDSWQRMLAVNLTGAYHCMQAALPAMLEAGWGRIVNVASTAGLTGYRYVAAYCAAKHGVVGLTRALALEVATKGVTVNAVCPGYTDTDIVQRSGGQHRAQDGPQRGGGARRTGRRQSAGAAGAARRGGACGGVAVHAGGGGDERPGHRGRRRGDHVMKNGKANDETKTRCDSPGATIRAPALDAESRVTGDHHQALKLWLRMLACTVRVEDGNPQPPAHEFGITLPRFDLMAQLERHPEGLRMGELSKRMMVTGGNVTGIADQLEQEGLVLREADAARRPRLQRAPDGSGPARLQPHGGGARRLDRGADGRPQRGRAQHHDRAARHHEAALDRTRTERPLGDPMRYLAGEAAPAAGNRADAGRLPRRALPVRSASEGVATITLDRPERKNPLTFDSYAELRDLFRALAYADDVKAVVITGAGGNFCSGGDVHEIIGPLTKLDMPGLLAFTRMTGDLVKAMRACPQPIVAAVDGVCAGAGAILAMASDLRFGTARSKTAFLFTRVGLAGCDMGACAILPRLIGQGRAAELLYTGRAMGGEEGERWGFFNRLCAPDDVLAEAQALARQPGRRPDLRPRHDQEDAAAGVEHGRRRSHRGRGPGPGHLHGDQRFPPRLPRLRRPSRSRSSRETEMADTAYLEWPFFEARHARAGRASSMPGPAQHVAQRARHATSTPPAAPLVRAAGRGRLAAPRHRRQRVRRGR